MSEESSSNNAKKICGLCDENESKYSCPRCEVHYCSLDCYKSQKHIECSENFYRDCVNEELASQQADNGARQSMVDILKRMQDDPNEFDELVQNIENEELDSDDEEKLTLHERIQGLNLDDADELWDALTTDEKNDFEAVLNQGDVGSILPRWEPWWSYSKDQKLVQEVDIKDNTEEEALKKCPPFISVPKLSSMTTVQPSSSIRYNITNLLASYGFITRYFNGELEPVEATTYLINICANLDNNTVFGNVVSALESVVQRCQQSDLIQTDELSLEVMKHDTFLMLQGPSKENKSHYCKAALSHIHNLLSNAKTLTKSPSNEERKDQGEFSRKYPEHKKKHLPQLDISKVKKCIKKVEYYLAYIENSGMEFE